jgi:uncharacterized protein involved in exopolysaccharide biosynthesis
MDIEADNSSLRPATGVAPRHLQIGRAELRPAELAGVLRRGAVPIAACALAGAAAAYIYAASLPKSYTAYSAVAVEGDRLAIPELQGVLRTDASPDPMPLVRTEVQALGSHQLLARVVNELQLARDPEFNHALQPESTVGRATDWLKSWLPHGKSAATGNGTDDSVLNAASHALAISQDNRSLVIGVAFTSQNPQIAAAFVNRLVADYTAERQDRRTAADLGANTAITQRIDQVRGEIEQIEKKMHDLRAQSGVVSLRAGSVGQQQAEDLATAVSRATEQRSEIEANLARAQAAVSSGASDQLASVLGSETISRLREQESEASGRVADLSARFGPQYPALRSAEADLSAIRREVSGEAHRIVASLTTQLQVARAHEADVEAQLAQANKAGAKAQDVEAQLQQLQQDAATRRALYNTLLERAQQTVAQPHNDGMAEVRVLSTATPPGLPSAPNMKLAAGLGGLAGAMLAGIAAVARGLSHRQFRGDDDIQAATGAMVLARLRGRGGKSRWRLLASGTTALAADDETALRTANARLRGAARAGTCRVVAFTAAQPGPASGAVAAALARMAAREGPALLIESGSTGGAKDGVSAGNTGDWRDAVMHDAGSPLDILAVEDIGGGAGGLDRIALENLLIEARDDYALIVLSGPVANDAASLSLARTADVTVVVVDEAAADPAFTREAATRLASMSRARLCAISLAAA